MPAHSSAHFKLRSRRAHAALVLLCLLAAAAGLAVESIHVDVGDIEGDGWTASEVEIVLDLPGTTTARVSAKRVVFPPPLGTLERITAVCPNPEVREPVFRCRRADVRGHLGMLGEQHFTADVTYRSDTQALEFSIAGLRIAGGAVRVAGRWREGGWLLGIDAKNAQLAALRKFASGFAELPKEISLEGETSFHADLRGGDSLQSADVQMSLAKIVAGNAEGTMATDQLGLDLRAHLVPTGENWQITGTIASRTGQAYGDPVFVDFAQHPLELSATARWLSDKEVLELEKAEFAHTGIARGTASGTLDIGGETLLRKLRLDLQSVEFPGTFATVLRPFLLDTDFRELTTRGSISGTVEIDDGEPAALDLVSHDVTGENPDGKLALRALTGRLVWQSSARRTSGGETGGGESDLRWQSSSMYGISGGSAHVRFAASGAGFRLLESTELPILDGGLRIRTLDVQEFGTPQMSLHFEGELKPISMAQLSTAFGWPEFAGTLSGRIPQVTLENRVLAFGGDLEASVFGGSVVVSGLRLRDPLGQYPRLSANMKLRNLDLEAVTGTFSFGTITGRLEGDVRNLELFRWAPVGFNARFGTPAGDRSRHRISQRAVKNLSNIGGGGGGVAAALSGGFLRFFDEFRYDRLGLSCRLENDVCFMDGVVPATSNSYYIVKGSGIPRIDIIGNAHRVSWQRLVGQLRAIQQSGGAVVE